MRLEPRLRELRRMGRKALVAFITAGDPTQECTVPGLRALVAGGADVLELGMPFSDPEADGPAIQASHERALARGMRLADVLAIVRDFRELDPSTPVVLMGYLNPIERMGYEPFAERCAEAGVDGVLLVNLPPEESAPLAEALKARGVQLVFMVAPTTTVERARLIARHASGFIYYVLLKGVTGANHLAANGVDEGLVRLRGITDLPVMVGFGIKDAASARSVSRHADGVAVGSAFVAAMGQLAETPEAIPATLTATAADIRSGLDAP